MGRPCARGRDPRGAGCAGLRAQGGGWARHPHAQAVAAQPLLEIERIGDAPPVPLPAGARRSPACACSTSRACSRDPTCARRLAEHGADVLKITAAHLPDSGLVELDTGIGKFPARLDLRTPAGVDTLRALAREADVFSQSYRPGALAARGFSPQALAELRPGIVCVRSAHGAPTGPWRDRRGFDSIVQSVSGMALASGEGGKPQLLPVSAIDYVSGYLMAFGAMVALARRASEGGSWLVRVALARVGAGSSTGAWYRTASGAACPTTCRPRSSRRCSRRWTRRTAGSGILRPVVQLSETPPYWSRPPVPLDYHRPEWPARRRGGSRWTSDSPRSRSRSATRCAGSPKSTWRRARWRAPMPSSTPGTSRG